MTIAGSAGGAVKLIGTDEIDVGEQRIFLRVDLPTDYQNTYDLIIGLCSIGTVIKDWLYAPFSVTTASGAYIACPAGGILRIPLVLQQDSGQVFYRGVTTISEAVSTSGSDFLTIRAYANNAYLIEGSNLTVYGIKF